MDRAAARVALGYAELDDAVGAGASHRLGALVGCTLGISFGRPLFSSTRSKIADPFITSALRGFGLFRPGRRNPHCRAGIRG